MTAVDVPANNRTLSIMAQKSKVQLARERGLNHDILIPMPILVSEIDLKRKLADKNEINPKLNRERDSR